MCVKIWLSLACKSPPEQSGSSSVSFQTNKDLEPSGLALSPQRSGSSELHRPEVERDGLDFS